MKHEQVIVAALAAIEVASPVKAGVPVEVAGPVKAGNPVEVVDPVKIMNPVGAVTSAGTAEKMAVEEAGWRGRYFTIEELVRSETARRLGIDNSPPAEAVGNMRRLIDSVLDPAREALGMAIIVNSGYRCGRLNRAVGGVARSYHLSGRAADLTTGDAGHNRRLLEILRGLPHRELIWERGGAWIHVAY